MTALHMTRPLARSLVNVLKPLLRKDGTFDLVDTRRHNVIEHDASLTRMDFHQGDNYTFRPEMLEAIIADADGGPVTLKSLARTFVRRNRESQAAGAPRMGLKLWFVSALQAVSPMNTAQTDGKLSREVLHALFAEDRLPDIILHNPKPRTLLGLLGNALGMIWHVVFD